MKLLRDKVAASMWKARTHQKKQKIPSNSAPLGSRPAAIQGNWNRGQFQAPQNQGSLPSMSSSRKFYSIKDLSPATSSSGTLEIICPEDLTITQGQSPYMLKTGIMGSIPPQRQSIILGRSSLNIKGTIIITGIIDLDSMREIIVMITVPVTWTFRKGEGIEQLLLLPYVIPEKSDRK